MMNKKIIATIMALGMVVTAFTMVATPVKATVPTFNTINLLMEPIVTDNTASAISIAGACNVGVSASVEVSLVANFAKGTGTTFQTTLDNNTRGTFKCVCAGLIGASTYNWRLQLTNATDIIYFPSLATTRTAQTMIPGTVPSNGVSVGRVYGTLNVTSQGANWLSIIQVETAGVQSYPMAVMSAATGNAAFIGNNLRRSDSTDYMQVAIGSIVRYGAYGNSDSGTKTWYNHTIPGGEPTSTVFPVGTGQCQLLAAALPGTYDIHLIQKVVAAATYPPETSALTAWNPSGLAGVITSEWVRLNATITDTEAPSDIITAAEYRVDGGAWTPMTAVDGAFNDEASEAVTALFSFPNAPFAIGAHTFDVRGTDNADGLNATFASSIFTITDTTLPVITTNSVPGATIYANQPATFQIGYGDFTDYNPLIASSYFRYRVGVAPWTTVVWTPGVFAFGSYLWTLGYTIPGGTFAAGNVVTYEGQVTDTAGVPNIGAWASGSFTVLAAAAGVQDPYPIYGYVSLYDGTQVGGYAPLISAGGPVVTATWISSATNLPINRAGTVNALGQFSIDLLNYTTGTRVLLTVPAFDAPYNNAGSNWTTIDIVGFPGGREQNVVCGVPYSFTITAPVPLANEVAGIGFPATYVIRDRAGLTAQGYYTFNDGNTRWTSSDVTFVPPATTQFDGIGGGNGVGNNVLTLSTGGLQWINISETVCDWYPTPWNNFQVMTGFAGIVPVDVPGWQDDFDNITVNVLSGGFSWRVVDGWNIVSVPQDPVNKGANGIFDSFDALNYCHWQLPGVAVLSLADRVPGNPSTYNLFDYGQAEAAAFPMDGTHGYWVFADVAGICAFNATNYSVIGANIVNAAAGWNLLGFTHNYVVWTITPTAQQFTNGAVSATLGIGVGGNTKIVATQWLFAAAPQWYNSYVVTTTFPGMGAPYNWAWDFAYAAQPGNGYFLWLTAPTVITFNVNY